MRLPKRIRRAATQVLAQTGLGRLRTTHLPPGKPEPLDSLATRVEKFPSMGGMEIGPFLQQIGRSVPASSAVVEVGVWLGAGTAQLCHGVAERRSRGEETPSIHCYDRWSASRTEVAKAAIADVRLTKGDDTLPWVIDALRPFGAEVYFHKGDLDFLEWTHGPVGAFILDAAKGPRQFVNMIRTFGPSWIPEETLVVLMDYHYHKMCGNESFACQERFIEANSDHFSQVDLGVDEPGTTAAFTYTKALDFDRAFDMAGL